MDTDLQYRFSLPDGALTTYDSYPERTLPDGRVCATFKEVFTSSRLLIAPGLVVRDSTCLAWRHIREPRSPDAKDGSAPSSHATEYRQFCGRCWDLAKRAHGVASRAKSGFGTSPRPDKHRSEKPETAETAGQVIHKLTQATL